MKAIAQTVLIVADDEQEVNHLVVKTIVESGNTTAGVGRELHGLLEELVGKGYQDRCVFFSRSVKPLRFRRITLVVHVLIRVPVADNQIVLGVSPEQFDAVIVFILKFAPNGLVDRRYMPAVWKEAEDLKYILIRQWVLLYLDFNQFSSVRTIAMDEYTE